MSSSGSSTSFSDTVIKLQNIISLHYSFYFCAFFWGGGPITKITTQKGNICGQEFLPFSAVGVNKMKIASIGVGNLAAAVC
jgi:hypothetical protein